MPLKMQSWCPFPLISLLLLMGCAVPQYDAQTDKLISTLQTDVDTEMVALISLAHTVESGVPDASTAKTKIGYDANKNFYSKVDVELMSIKLRVDAAPNPSTASLDKALQDIQDNILSGEDSLQYVHQQPNIMSEFYLTQERVLLAQQFQALLTYELVLKNGDPVGNNGSASPATSSTTKQ